MDFGSWNGGLGREVGNLAIYIHAYSVIIIIANPVQGPMMVIPIFCVKSTRVVTSNTGTVTIYFIFPNIIPTTQMISPFIT